jgi:hypothetical protein
VPDLTSSGSEVACGRRLNVGLALEHVRSTRFKPKALA